MRVVIDKCLLLNFCEKCIVGDIMVSRPGKRWYRQNPSVSTGQHLLCCGSTTLLYLGHQVISLGASTHKNIAVGVRRYHQMSRTFFANDPDIRHTLFGPLQVFYSLIRESCINTVEFHELGQKVRILGQGQEQDSSVD